MVAPYSKSYTVSTVLFHKYVGANVAVTNCKSRFYMFLSTKATLKLANGNTGHAQGIEVILCRFPKCSIIYPVVPVYYCPGHLTTPYHKVLSNFMLVFKRLRLNLLNILNFLTLRFVIGYHPT